MDWDKADKRHDLNTIEGKIYQGLLHLIKVRKSTSLLHSFAFIRPMWTDNEHVVALSRIRPEGTVTILANFDNNWQSVNSDMIEHGKLSGSVRNLLAEKSSFNISEGRLYLEPYESMWLASDE